MLRLKAAYRWPMLLELFKILVAPMSTQHGCGLHNGFGNLPWVLWLDLWPRSIDWLRIWFEIWVYVIAILSMRMFFNYTRYHMNKILGIYEELKCISFSSIPLFNQDTYFFFKEQLVTWIKMYTLYIVIYIYWPYLSTHVHTWIHTPES